MRVFVNYRTGDGEGTALLVARFLAERIGAPNVFHASGSIRPGALFDHELLSNVWRSDVLIAVIGSRWLDAPDRRGRALDNPADWVRREIAEALTHRVVVVPLLVGDAELPTADQLPADLAGLVRCQYVKLDYRAPDAGLGRLAETVGAAPGAGAGRSREPASDGGGQRGGIGSISGTYVTAVTDARGPVHLGWPADHPNHQGRTDR